MSAAGRPSRVATAAVRTLAGLAIRLVRQWWPHLLALAAACGVVAATIAGGLGVGDALTRSLRRLALARLGGIRAAVLADGLFRARLADETTARLRPQAAAGGGVEPVIDPAVVPALVPAVVMEVTLERAAGGERSGAGSSAGSSATRATLLACDEPDRLGFFPPTNPPAADAVAINRVLADALGARVGDPVVLRLAKIGDVPADSPMGRRTAESWSRRLVVTEVLPAAGLGEFSLRPTQVTAGLAVTSLATAQSLVRRSEPVANTLFAVAGMPAADSLRMALEPTLDDLGLSFDQPRGSGAWRLSSRRLLLPPEADRAAERVLVPRGGRPTLVFLANALVPLVDGRPGRASIPYSTVVGIDSASLPVGDLVDDRGDPLALPGPDEIVIDRWMADDLAAQGTPVAVGDRLEVRSFLPETLHGRVEEQACTLVVSGIAAMRGAAVARDLVPEVEGITDEDSIADWDPPFPFDRSRVRTVPPHDEDDRYWKAHGATPKAFVSLSVARRLAASRFGATTAWHLPAAAEAASARAWEPEAIRAELARAARAEGLGMRVVPLRDKAEEAARGSTPFGSLFLALSSFIVVAGLLLEWLLFSLLVAARRRDIGILAAIGWPPARVTRLLAGVAAAAVLAGVVTGTALGPLWSRLLVGWLATAWDTQVAAGSGGAFDASGPVFTTDTLRVLLPAAATAAAVSLVAAAVAAWRAARLGPLELLKGTGETALPTGKAGVAAASLVALGPGLAVALAWWAGRADSQAAAGLFFGAGCAALAGLLAGVRLLLGRGSAAGRRPLRSLADLAWRGLTHGRSRAFSVAAIVACAEFLIVAVSSFALHPPARPDDRDAPTGGWTFMATFGSPNGIDPGDPVARESLGLAAAELAELETCAITRIRSSAGDDASCVNLYAPTQPTVLGVGTSFIDRGGFRFVAHAALAPPAMNPWTLLERDVSTAEPVSFEPVPVIVDQATAQWALKLGGVGARFELAGDDGPVPCEVVGLLEPGILQGFLLVSEAGFTRLFPRRSGYSLALVDAGPATDAARLDRVSRAIAAAWADAGVSITRTTERLRSLQAVQNTFLAGFQALGTLGLVLGAAGVAAVQFQSVLERLGALGLLAAVGFTGPRLRLFVVMETVLMVFLGLVVGTLAGCLAVVPAFTGGQAVVPAGWIACTWAVTLLAAVAAGLAAAGRVSRLDPARLLAAAE
jgi:hypothetical protein